VKIKTINVVITYDYCKTDIHSYFIADNLPANKVNESVREAMDKFRESIEAVVDALSLTLKPLNEEEMAYAMEREFWDSRHGTVIEIIRSEV